MSGITHVFTNPHGASSDATKTDGPKWNQPHVIGPGTFLFGASEFGLGIDGPLAFDGVATTVAGATLSGGVYTLTRDVHASSITIASGITVKLANWRMFGTGKLLGAGSGLSRIHNDGLSASGAAAGASTPAGFYAATLVGGNGTSGTGSGGNAVGTNTAAPPIYAGGQSAGGSGSGTAATDGVSGSTYGQGGGGGGVMTDPGHGGQIGGSSTLVSALAAFQGYGPDELLTMRSVVGANLYVLGAAGGGGSAQTVVNGTTIANFIGGGGGASAGRATVCVQQIVGVTISARGGNGANGSLATGGSPQGAGAGGGGGSGGEIVAKFCTCSDLICDVTGGVGGTGVSTVYTAKNGGNGFKGRVFPYNLAGDGTAPTIVP